MKIVVLSHGFLARELVNTCGMIVQDMPEISYVCLDGDGVGKFELRLRELIDSLKGENVIFLCDLNYGTPHNQLMLALIARNELKDYRIITGANLPVLLQVCIMAHESNPLDTVVRQCYEDGKGGFVLYEK